MKNSTIEIVDSKFITLREAGRDEDWLHRWIVDKPDRLGLGPLEIISQELRHYKNKGGRLDLLGYARSLNVYYEIEVMLGECDSDHGFRTLDYWARERVKAPNSIHYAVLVAENLQGRYKTIIETLPQFLPFIAIEIRTRQLTTSGVNKLRLLLPRSFLNPMNSLRWAVLRHYGREEAHQETRIGGERTLETTMSMQFKKWQRYARNKLDLLVSITPLTVTSH
jgi:hypothetical protein